MRLSIRAERRGEEERSWGAGPYASLYVQIVPIRLRKQSSLQMKSAMVVFFLSKHVTGKLQHTGSDLKFVLVLRCGKI